MISRTPRVPRRISCCRPCSRRERLITLTRAGELVTSSWQGLFFDAQADTAHSVLAGLRVRYAGRTSVAWNGQNWNSNINVFASSPALDSCQISNGFRHGVQALNSRLALRGCTLENNGQSETHYDLHTDASSLVSVQDCVFGVGQLYAARVGIDRPS